MGNFIVKILGFMATVLYGDMAVFDRWLWLRKNLQKGNIKTLDAGCGSGAFTIYAAKKGNEIVGISFDDRNNKVATRRAEILNFKNIKFIKADLRKLDEIFKKKEIFDQIICFETIEHILNDKKLIKDLSILLKSGGRLLLTAPYQNYINLYKDRLSDFEDGGHVRKGYTFEELEKLTSESGLKIESREYITGFISQQLINFLRITGEVNPILGEIIGVIFIPLRLAQFFDPFLTRLINYPFLSVAIMAKKIK
jgi:2-polyprenyl-3-methyl-5-hydroxy-6-metoxy-1,4-benzoquinol methylase